MKYATAVHVIRRRNGGDIPPGGVMEIEELDEFKRLEGQNAVREATPDEIKMYLATVKAGEKAAAKVEGAAAVDDSEDLKKTDGRKTVVKPGAQAKAAETGDTSKTAESKTSSTSTAPAGGKTSDEDI